MQSNPDGPEGRGEADDPADLAWRSIVENYGDRAELDEPPVAPEAPATPVAPVTPFGGRFGDARNLGDPFGIAEEDDEEDVDRFEPPTPPPLPRVAPDRMAAWLGIFGSPALLLAALIFSIRVPTMIAYLLVAAFVGGFVYLVAKMPRGPRDPWDDGAQV